MQEVLALLEGLPQGHPPNVVTGLQPLPEMRAGISGMDVEGVCWLTIWWLGPIPRPLAEQPLVGEVLRRLGRAGCVAHLDHTSSALRRGVGLESGPGDRLSLALYQIERDRRG